jgi:hypothetical protein
MQNKDDPEDRIYHSGFNDYRAICQKMAPQVDGLVSAATVVNWIPAEPITGMMATQRHRPGDIVQVPFMLVPQVLTEMRSLNPKINLIGCKLTSGSTKEDLIGAAYCTLEASQCNVVVASDLSDLHTKHLVYPDRTVSTYKDQWFDFTKALAAVLTDEHFQTTEGAIAPLDPFILDEAKFCHSIKVLETFDLVANKYRDRFLTRGCRTLGAIAVRLHSELWLCTPRYKYPSFTAWEAVAVKVDFKELVVQTQRDKVSLSAPHMIGLSEAHNADVVLHLHEQMPGWDTLPYTPSGTKRDLCLWSELPKHYNIEGHGFMACLNEQGEIL